MAIDLKTYFRLFKCELEYIEYFQTVRRNLPSFLLSVYNMHVARTKDDIFVYAGLLPWGPMIQQINDYYWLHRIFPKQIHTI